MKVNPLEKATETDMPLNQNGGQNGGGLIGSVLGTGSGNSRQQFCGDIDMRIGADGRWYYQGSPIGRHELVCLLASVLRRDEEGDYWLETPVEKARIQVDDAPFVVVEMYHCDGHAGQVISFRTNVDEMITLDDEHPLRVEIDPETGEPSPYVMVRDGLEAKLLRPVYYHLVNHGVFEQHEKEVFGVWSNGQFFKMGDLPKEMEP